MSIAKEIECIDIIPLEKTQVSSAAKMLSRAFNQDPKFIHAIPNNKKRKAVLHKILEFELKYGIIYGQVYTTSQNLEGIAFWLPSQYATISTWGAIKSGALMLPFYIGFRALIRGISLSDNIDKMRNKHLTEPYIYLFFIGVDPVFQGKGYASRLIRPILKYLDNNGLQCYLITENKHNITLYEHFGFKVIDNFLVPGTSVENWAMLRKPIKSY